jgi:hypothetical protein
MNKCKCGKNMSFYAKQCQKCYTKTLKGKNNPMFGKKRPDLSKRNKLNPMKGENNPSYKDGRSLVEKFCKDCGKRLFSYRSIRCQKCYFKIRISWNKNKKIGKNKCTHHLDLNKKNNNKDNRLKLTNSQHAKLHQKAYEYLVKRGLIKRYIKWFFKKEGIKCLK